MESNSSYLQAINKASALCSKSEKCKADLILYFEKWNFSAEEIKKALDFLIKERFIDEQRFTNHYVHDKFYLNKWGKYKIHHMLRMKKIPEEIINNSLNAIPVEEYEDRIRNLLLTKARSIKGDSLQERKTKLINFAQGRGFEIEIVFRIAEEVLAEATK